MVVVLPLQFWEQPDTNFPLGSQLFCGSPEWCPLLLGTVQSLNNEVFILVPVLPCSPPSLPATFRVVISNVGSVGVQLRAELWSPWEVQDKCLEIAHRYLTLRKWQLNQGKVSDQLFLSFLFLLLRWEKGVTLECDFPFCLFTPGLVGTSLKPCLLFQISHRADLSENFCQVKPFLILMPQSSQYSNVMMSFMKVNYWEEVRMIIARLMLDVWITIA